MNIRYIPYRVFTVAPVGEMAVHRFARAGVIADPAPGYGFEQIIAALKQADEFIPGDTLELEYSVSRAYFAYDLDGQISGPVYEPKGAV